MIYEKKAKYYFDYTNWTPKEETAKFVDLIDEIISGNYEARKNFISKSIDTIIYVVDYVANARELKQEDIDDLMTVGIFGVDKAINTIIKYKNTGKDLVEANVYRFIHYNILNAIDHYFFEESKRIKAESYENLIQAVEKNPSKLVDGLQDTADIDYFNQLEQLEYLRRLVKEALKAVPKHELKMFFEVYPLSYDNESGIAFDVATSKMGLREIGAKYGLNERQTINRVSKILRNMRAIINKDEDKWANPLKK